MLYEHKEARKYQNSKRIQGQMRYFEGIRPLVCHQLHAPLARLIYQIRLGLYAFYRILLCKETRIGWLLQAIQMKLHDGRYQKIKRSGKFDNIIRQGLINMKNVKF